MDSRCLRYPSAEIRARLRTLAMYWVRSVTLIAPLASNKLKVWEHFKQ